jgi:hypothetical protein
MTENITSLSLSSILCTRYRIVKVLHYQVLADLQRYHLPILKELSDENSIDPRDPTQSR